MRPLFLAAVLVFGAAGAAQAKIPLLNATCGGGIEVHADEGGPVYINGKQAKLKKENSNYYEATHGHTTISMARTEDGSWLLSYTGKNQANGVCTLVDYSPGSVDTGCPADVSEADRYLYPACN